ncbi:hypothetical protein R70006_06201 [Paraburkholderia domus]|uniref:hypothetical protein n=1 Tax=Paraburkholderia domus TaxID=2793075 RepID=UPI001912B834|nr:hypothetical protein [Paraburkholderia domus]MBK5052833.1 hypothetical protein [Burkholderia sp. R-70006]CAE6821110.1 hypothetical protein R70006_06201 [Paraburkholderia domus]
MRLDLLSIEQHTSASYGPRTWANAAGADITVAFAVDFTTAGELLTKRAAGDRYLAIDLGSGLKPIEAARLIYRECKRRSARSVNVAGNGVYTLGKHGWSQVEANAFVHASLAKVHEFRPFEYVRSGGQTGIDLAGGIAGIAMDVPTTMLFPAGLRQRHVDKVDRLMSEIEIVGQVRDGLAALLQPESRQPQCEAAVRSTASFDDGPGM